MSNVLKTTIIIMELLVARRFQFKEFEVRIQSTKRRTANRVGIIMIIERWLTYALLCMY